MKKYWIYNKTFDLIWILLPPIFIWFIVMFFHQQLQEIQEGYSFYTWLILIVFIDVAHVYASIFRSYLVKEKWKKHKLLFCIIPITCFLLSLLLYSFGASVFWSVLAYVAVFHFIRQQYGFLRLYNRNERLSKGEKLLDTVVIYNATVYPMLYWFLHADRRFTWFMPNEFIHLNLPVLEPALFSLYSIILITYMLYLLVFRIRKKEAINYQKLLLISGTYLSWYFGIVHFNNELVFTLLNVISHGIPYMALVYFTEFKMKSHDFRIIGKVKQSISVLVFVGGLLFLAVIEEFTWETLVWKEQVGLFEINWEEIWVVPLLALPQFTHYILDAFIWKRSYSKYE
ncbi:MAG: hypothetical protein J0G96_04525 [Flavobacteriia bacterium]|nr:hypothetical protein [Flavobacteriia bacterium]OJX37200.1 MAG: hypothetical protein BGO87_14755 [Flavobacteriia bacterium 40-80]